MNGKLYYESEKVNLETYELSNIVKVFSIKYCRRKMRVFQWVTDFQSRIFT